MKYLLPLVLLIASCAGGISAEKKLQIAVRNDTDRPLEFHARSGIFGRTVKLEPGHTWRGWVLREWVGEGIRIEVCEPDPEKP